MIVVCWPSPTSAQDIATLAVGDPAPFAGKLVKTERLAKLVAVTEGLKAELKLSSDVYEQKLLLLNVQLEDEQGIFMEALNEQQKVVDHALTELSKQQQDPWWREPILWLSVGMTAGVAAVLLVGGAPTATLRVSH